MTAFDSAIALAYGAGLLAGCGPCAAPRLLAFVAVTSNGLRPAKVLKLVAFSIGTACGYVAMAGAFSTFAGIAVSRQAYALLAVLCLAGSIAGLRPERSGPCDAKCRREYRISGAPAFVGGFAAALLGAPCCLPLLGVLAAPSAATPAPTFVAFVAGQMTPLAGAVACGAALRAGVRSFARESGALVCAGLMLFLAGYYAVLA
ncbi:MAG: hypothetical protein ACLQPV_06830 [Vulcanimicrobiaceae bacterium]